MARFKYFIETYNLTGSPGDYGVIRCAVYSRVGHATFRIYKVGNIPPAFSDLGLPQYPGLASIFEYTDLSPGEYVLEYSDDVLTQVLAHVQILGIGTTCVPNTPTLQPNIITQLNIVDSAVQARFGGSGTVAGSSAIKRMSIDGVTYKTVPGSSLLSWTDAEVNAAGGSPVTLYNQLGGCNFNTVTNLYLSSIITPLAVSYNVTSTTANGSSDGKINLLVSGGSGNYTYLWGDGATTQNRTGLLSATYTVDVHDVTTGEDINLSIFVPEPGAVIEGGTFLRIPAMNSLTFVIDQNVDECDNLQGLDNVLLCEQYYEGFDQTNYFQKLNKCDQPPIQWESDYSLFTIELRRYIDGVLIKTFDYDLKEQNIGLLQDFGITIRNHTTPGQSRVYFNVGVIPLPLSNGDSFEILNNANGYNGNFTIVSINNDATLGYQYLVITKNFLGAVNENGTGRFTQNTVSFNVFESLLGFTDVAEGQHYLKLIAYNSTTSISATSEPIDLRLVHDGVILIRYKNVDNAFNLTWTTGYLGLLRIPGHFGHKRNPGGERSVSRNADYSLTKVNAKKIRTLTVETWSLPPYIHEKLSVVFDCDFFSVNKLECQSNEGYGDPQYKDRFLLANSSIKVETKWFDNYNSDDIGSVADGGFLLSETGFIKR